MQRDVFCYTKLQNQSRSGFKYNFLADCYVQKHVFLLYITNINILTQVLTVLQIVKGVRIAHTVDSGCATGWVTWEMVFDSQQGQSFLPSQCSDLFWGPPCQWVLGALATVVKQHRHEAAHAPLCNARVKNAWCYTFTPQYTVMTRDKFIVYTLQSRLAECCSLKGGRRNGVIWSLVVRNVQCVRV